MATQTFSKSGSTITVNSYSTDNPPHYKITADDSNHLVLINADDNSFNLQVNAALDTITINGTPFTGTATELRTALLADIFVVTASGPSSPTQYTPTEITFTRTTNGFTVETPETGVLTYNNAIASASVNSSLISININGDTFYNFDVLTISSITVNGAAYTNTASGLKTLLENHVFNDINGILRKYVAVMTQSGTDAPSATVLENSIGDIVWTRQNAGVYIGTLAGAFTPDKTWAVATSRGFSANSVMVFMNSADTIKYETADNTWTDVDGETVYIEILVYP